MSRPALRPSRPALVRLWALVFGLVAAGVVFTAGGVVGTGTVRGWVEPAGWAGPLAYVVVAGVLGAALVPGAALAAASGLLFGAGAGAAASLGAAVVSALLARELSWRVAGDAPAELRDPRSRAIVAFARRNGFAAVVVQRLLPAVPDGPFSHAFGVVGVTRRQIGLGTLVASGPRSLAYALLGSGAADATGPNAVAGVVLWVATGVAGVVLAAWVVRRERHHDPGLDAGDGTGAADGPSAAPPTALSSSRPPGPTPRTSSGPGPDR